MVVVFVEKKTEHFPKITQSPYPLNDEIVKMEFEGVGREEKGENI